MHARRLALSLAVPVLAVAGLLAAAAAAPLVAPRLAPHALAAGDPTADPLCALAAAHAPASTPCNLWASRLPEGPANELAIAVDPTNDQHVIVVAKDYGLGANGDCRPSGQFHVASASYVTFDGGSSWQVARVPAPYPNGGASPSPLPYKCGSDPVVKFGPDGTAYYVLLNFQYTGGRQAAIAVARSHDGGVTWPASDIRILHSASGDDKEWGVVDRAGRVHVAWVDVDSGRILYARSDASFTFEAPRVLATAGAGNPGVTLVAGLASDVYAFWRDGPSIKFVKSADAGATWQTIRLALTVTPYDSSGTPRFPFMPQSAVDANALSPFAGRLYLVWPDARLGDSSVWASSSGDGGATWSAPARVDDNAIPQKRQVMPAVSVAPNGRVDVAWMDERVGAAVPEVLMPFSAFAASSVDGGASWSANVRVSEVPLNAYWSHHQDGSVFIGDYMGIASTARAAFPAFPGNGLDRLGALGPARMQRADAYTAAVPWGAPAADASQRAPVGVVASVPIGDVPFTAFSVLYPGED